MTKQGIRAKGGAAALAYGSGMGSSKLKIPAAANGTERNMNTVAKLVEMAGAL